MIAGIDYLRIFSVMITDWETNFTDLQANDFGNLGKNNSRNILVGNHAVIFTKWIPPDFFSVGNVCVENGNLPWYLESRSKIFILTFRIHLGGHFGPEKKKN